MRQYQTIVGVLTARTTVHIGSGGGGDVTDSLCRRNAAGRLVLPGMAIAGALRTLATRIAPSLGGPLCRDLRFSAQEISQSSVDRRSQPCGCGVCRLFGDVNPSEGNTEESGGRASRLIVAQARLKLPENRPPRIQDGVGIERTTGAAARTGAVKFDREVLPAGTWCRVRFELEEAHDDDWRLLAAVLEEWKEGRAFLGAGSSRGMGAFDLSQVEYRRLDLSDPEILIRYLHKGKPWKTATVVKDFLTDHLQQARDRVRKSGDRQRQPSEANSMLARSFLTCDFQLELTGPFLSNDPLSAARSGLDHAPLVEAIGQKDGRLILTGAGFRGVLRTRAEQIVRTLATLAAGEDRQRFLVQRPACNVLEGNPGQPLASCDALIRQRQEHLPRESIEREVPAHQLCLACQLFGSQRRGARLKIEDAFSADNTFQRGKVQDFLAIDRFTGGGKEGAKFDALASIAPRFPIRLHLNNPQPWETGWLLLILRELAEGMLTVGFGGAKGYGRTKVATFHFTHGFLNDVDMLAGARRLASKRGDSGIFQTIAWSWRPQDRDSKFLNAADDWIGQFHQLLLQPPDDAMRFANDTWFEEPAAPGRAMRELYPLENIS